MVYLIGFLKISPFGEGMFLAKECYNVTKRCFVSYDGFRKKWKKRN